MYAPFDLHLSKLCRQAGVPEDEYIRGSRRGTRAQPPFRARLVATGVRPGRQSGRGTFEQHCTPRRRRCGRRQSVRRAPHWSSPPLVAGRPRRCRRYLRAPSRTVTETPPPAPGTADRSAPYHNEPAASHHQTASARAAALTENRPDLHTLPASSLTPHTHTIWHVGSQPRDPARTRSTLNSKLRTLHLRQDDRSNRKAASAPRYIKNSRLRKYKRSTGSARASGAGVVSTRRSQFTESPHLSPRSK